MSMMEEATTTTMAMSNGSIAMAMNASDDEPWSPSIGLAMAVDPKPQDHQLGIAAWAARRSFASMRPVIDGSIAMLAAVDWGSQETACVLALLALVLLWLTAPSKYDLDKIPGPWRTGKPVIGNALDLLKPNFHRQMLSWANEHGGVYRMRVFWRNVLVVSDPQAVGAIMGRGDGALDKAEVAYGPINQMVEPRAHPNVLTAASDPKWKAIRRAVAASFSHGNIKRKWPMVLAKINELVDRCRARGPEASVDVDQAALRVTLDVVGLAAFGHDYEAVKQDSPAYDHMLRVLPRCFTEVELRMANPLRGMLPSWLWRRGRKGERSFRRFHADMAALFDEMLARGEPAEDDQSVGAQLLRLRASGTISDARLLSEIGIMFVEGFETTGHTVSWTLFTIATTPGVQDKVAEELDSHGLLAKPGAPPPREVEYEDLRKLQYLNWCVKESMRLYPVISVGHGRGTVRPTKVGDYTIPAGVIVTTPLYCLHNAERNWEKPMQFLPERWKEVPVEAYVHDSTSSSWKSGTRRDPQPDGEHPGSTVGPEGACRPGGKGITFMPFSDGPRNCVGQSLAKMEVLALLVKLLGSFRLRLAPEMGGVKGVVDRESTHLTLQTKGTKGIRMNLMPRDVKRRRCRRRRGSNKAR